ncbi:MAG: histidine phosphatase family protein [Anaerolineae bacterium]
MHLYFARHGESYANQRREISNRGLRHGLTATGREQARTLAEHLKPRGITHLYASPVLRAIETCITVAHELNLDYTITEALREYDCGCMEGRSDEAAWQAWQALFDDWVIHQRYDQRIDGGESFHDIRARFIPFINGLIEQFGATNARIVCIAHGGLYWMMLPLILKNIDTDFIRRSQFAYTACITAEWRPSGLWCTDWNGLPVETPPE